MDRNRKAVSIVLPAYNEASSLEKAVEEVMSEMNRFYSPKDYEIIIAEDGSTDGTDKIAENLARKYDNVIHLHSDERLGRGRALFNAFKQSKGEILVYLDVDLSTNLKHLKQLIDSIAIEGYDFATGSRLMKESRTERPFKRNFASKSYNFLVRLFLGSKLKDHQCGFKAFKRDVLFRVAEKAKDTHWFWDTEIMVLAQKMGYKVKEIPVTWKQGSETKVRFGRDILYMFGQIMRMLFDHLKRRGEV
jgi:hypothetical protein